MKEKELIQKFGNPILEKCRSGWCVPDPNWYNEHIANGTLGEAYYADCVLTHDVCDEALYAVTLRCEELGVWLNWVKELTSWVPRTKMLNPKRSLSLHAWGLAVDINWTENPYGQPNQTIPDAFIQIMKDCGFIWGGDWKVPDPHHFELDVEEL